MSYSAQVLFSNSGFGNRAGAPLTGGNRETPRISWATVQEGLALVALFGSFYCWLWLGWAMTPG